MGLVHFPLRKSSSASKKSSSPFLESESRPAYVIVGFARPAVENGGICSIGNDSTFRGVDLRIELLKREVLVATYTDESVCVREHLDLTGIPGGIGGMGFLIQ